MFLPVSYVFFRNFRNIFRSFLYPTPFLGNYFHLPPWTVFYWYHLPWRKNLDSPLSKLNLAHMCMDY